MSFSAVKVAETKKYPQTRLMFEEVPLAGTSILGLARSYDGNVYGIDNGWLFKSTDSMATKTNGIATGTFIPTYGTPVSITVFNDGTLSIATDTGYMLHMVDINTAPTVALETGKGFAGISVSSYSDGFNQYVLAGEYTQDATAKKIWLSKDGGKTFTAIKTGDALGSVNNHWHVVVYDSYESMIIAGQGDGENAKIYYSRDFGANWGVINGYQPTLIHPLPDKIVFGEDLVTLKPGLYHWDRAIKSPTVLEKTKTFREDRFASDFYPQNTHLIGDNIAEWYVLFFNHTSATFPVVILATGDAGKSFHMVYSGLGRLQSITNADKNGYIFAKDYTTSKLFRAKAITWG